MPCGHGGVWTWSEQVEHEFGLREEEVPAVTWRSWCCAREHSQEVVLECADGSFRPVSTVHMWWY
jgi:hypothetical protein